MEPRYNLLVAFIQPNKRKQYIPIQFCIAILCIYSYIGDGLLCLSILLFSATEYKKSLISIHPLLFCEHNIYVHPSNTYPFVLSHSSVPMNTSTLPTSDLLYSSSALPISTDSSSSTAAYPSSHDNYEFSSHTVYHNSTLSSSSSLASSSLSTTTTTTASSLFTPFVPFPSLLTDYRDNGYIRYKDFLSPTEVELVKKAVQEIIYSQLPILPPEHKFFENLNDPSTLKQIQSLASYHPTIQALALTKCRDLALYILSENGTRPNVTVECVNQQYFNKPPQNSAPTPPHQDGAYFLLTPPEALTIWIALEYVDEENGCVRYIPGSHRNPEEEEEKYKKKNNDNENNVPNIRYYRNHGPSGILGFSRAITDYNDTDRSKEIIQIANPGDLIAHHALTIHRADGNRSMDRTRQAIGLIYYSSLAKEDTVAKQAYQEKLKQRLIEEKKIR